MAHRAVTLAVMIVLSLLLVAVMLVGGIASWNSHSLVALLLVMVLAAVGGVAFSWRRYFARRRP